MTPHSVISDMDKAVSDPASWLPGGDTCVGVGSMLLPLLMAHASGLSAAQAARWLEEWAGLQLTVHDDSAFLVDALCMLRRPDAYAYNLVPPPHNGWPDSSKIVLTQGSRKLHRRISGDQFPQSYPGLRHEVAKWACDMNVYRFLVAARMLIIRQPDLKVCSCPPLRRVGCAVINTTDYRFRGQDVMSQTCNGLQPLMVNASLIARLAQGLEKPELARFVGCAVAAASLLELGGHQLRLYKVSEVA